MKLKLTTKTPNGCEWGYYVQGYDCFETEETLISFLNKAGCKTYQNKKGEVVACCGNSNIAMFLHKAEKLYLKEIKIYN